MWLSQLNTLSVASFHKKLCSNLSDYVGLESSRNDCFNIVESSSSNVKSDSIGDSDRVAAELLCLCGIFFFPPAPGLSIFSAQSFDSQPACLVPAINQANDALNCCSKRDVRVPKRDRRS